MAEIKKIFVNGKDEVEFFKQLEKRSGETNKKVTAVDKNLLYFSPFNNVLSVYIN